MKFVEYAKMSKKKKKEIDRERRSDWNRKRDKRNYTI